MIQSGTPSPFASAGTRIAWSSVTGIRTDANVLAPIRVVLVTAPTDAVIVTLPNGTMAL